MEEQAKAEAVVEANEGDVDWYRTPHGGGRNGAIRVPCDANGNKYRLTTQGAVNTKRVVYESGQPVTDGPPPAGEVCF